MEIHQIGIHGFLQMEIPLYIGIHGFLWMDDPKYKYLVFYGWITPVRKTQSSMDGYSQTELYGFI